MFDNLLGAGQSGSAQMAHNFNLISSSLNNYDSQPNY